MADSKGPQGATGGEDVTVDFILEQGAALLRGYVIERLNIDEPSRHVSLELLGGRPDELQDPELKQLLKELMKITVDLETNTELQRLIKRVPDKCSEDIFMKTAKNIFADGINWGRVLALFQMAYIFIAKALATNDEETVRQIQRLFPQVIREHVFIWLIQQGGWEEVITVVFPQWRTVAIVVSVALVAAVVYYRKTH
ncbi:apoptosis regulator BAX-like [Plectropomus leopardus]|uniref:apoptosis regulator BAX-like n=1 Tax=Plectropomus leopardus TaxID=160734 RepID=UPI001C4C49F0|nr:apoptosis regulator BAX-like [Plectropomus leopardus]